MFIFPVDAFVGEDKQAILVYDRQEADIKWWIKDLELYESDFKVLNSRNELTENIVNAVHKILSRQFPDIKGFQSTTHSHYLNFKLFLMMSILCKFFTLVGICIVLIRLVN